MAISMSHDVMISGSWAGDVIINSQAQFASLDDLYSVALHEAGHVLGLPHSDDPNSPMYFHGVSRSLEPQPGDVAQLQELHGVRLGDPWEGETGNNDTLANAARLEAREVANERQGSVPAFAFGDLTTPADVDIFRVEAPGDYVGPITVRLVTAGVSLVESRLAVLDRAGSVIAEETVNPRSGPDLSTTFQVPDGEGKFYVRVDSLRDDALAVGGYSLVVEFDAFSAIDPQIIQEIVTSRQRGLLPAAFDDFFDDDPVKYFNDDMHRDDDFATAERLKPLAGFAMAERYEFTGSLTSPTDQDNFSIRSPDRTAVRRDVMTVSLRSIDADQLQARAMLLDQQRQPLPMRVLVNGNGEFIAQVENVLPGADYVLRVTSNDPTGQRSTGNYELNMSFDQPLVNPLVFVSGAVEREAMQWPLHVAVPQLFHFSLDVPPTSSGGVRDPRVGALSRILDGKGTTVSQIMSLADEARTNGSVLLSPGSYTLQVIPIRTEASVVEAIPFTFGGSVVSNPLGVDPLQPGAAEFSCPDVSSAFCYPGDIRSTAPFVWSNLSTALPGVTSVDSSSIDTLMQWNSQWLDAASLGPSLSFSDAFTTKTGSVLAVGPADGVLANDIGPPQAVQSATLATPPSHGQLRLNADGSFQYEPDPGFVGIDLFQYRGSVGAFESPLISVTIDVTIDAATGDLDGDGQVGASDIVTLQLAVRNANRDVRFDLNADGAVNRDDLDLLIRDILHTTYGDANVDGIFDQRDIVAILQSNQYEDAVFANSTWLTGDWNSDGDFDRKDIVLALQTGDYAIGGGNRVAVKSPNYRRPRDNPLFPV